MNTAEHLLIQAMEAHCTRELSQLLEELHDEIDNAKQLMESLEGLPETERREILKASTVNHLTHRQTYLWP
jgi:hypothetical protein